MCLIMLSFYLLPPLLCSFRSSLGGILEHEELAYTHKHLRRLVQVGVALGRVVCVDILYVARHLRLHFFQRITCLLLSFLTLAFLLLFLLSLLLWGEWLKNLFPDATHLVETFDEG